MNLLAQFTAYKVLTAIDLNPTNDFNIKRNYLLWLLHITYDYNKVAIQKLMHKVLKLY